MKWLNRGAYKYCELNLKLLSIYDLKRQNSMKISKLRKKLGLYDLKKEGSKWVSSHLGPQFVDEFCEKYDSLNRGTPIGGFEETVVFLKMLEQIKHEI